MSTFSDELQSLTHSDINFVNSIAEGEVFKGWIDESCGNFVGWTKEFRDFSISIHRENTQTGGFYHVAKMTRGYRASSDYKSNLIFEFPHMSLLQIKELLSKYIDN